MVILEKNNEKKKKAKKAGLNYKRHQLFLIFKQTLISLTFSFFLISYSAVAISNKAEMMTLDEYKKQYSEDDAPGWEAIDNALEKLYPNQKPKHYGPTLKYIMGGTDPIDGFSVYDGGDFYHIVTYGFSSLYYDENSIDAQFSKYGFELTMRLPKSEGDAPYWAMNLMQNIARYVFQSGRWLESGHYMPTNSPIKLGADTKLVGLAFTNDPQLKAIDTVHGKVEFIQVFGITQLEIDQIASTDKTAENIILKHQVNNPLLIIDLERKDLPNISQDQ